MGNNISISPIQHTRDLSCKQDDEEELYMLVEDMLKRKSSQYDRKVSKSHL